MFLFLSFVCHLTNTHNLCSCGLFIVCFGVFAVGEWPRATSLTWEQKFAGVAFFFAGFAVAQRRKKFAGLAPQAKFLLFLLDMPSRSDGKILLGWRRLAPQPNFAE